MQFTQYLTRRPMPPREILWKIGLPAFLSWLWCWWLFERERLAFAVALPFVVVLHLKAIDLWRSWRRCQVLMRVPIVYVRKTIDGRMCYFQPRRELDDPQWGHDFSRAQIFGYVEDARYVARNYGGTFVVSSAFDAELQETGKVRIP